MKMFYSRLSKTLWRHRGAAQFYLHLRDINSVVKPSHWPQKSQSPERFWSLVHQHRDRAESASPRATQSFLQLSLIQELQSGKALLSFCTSSLFSQPALSFSSFSETASLFKCSNKNQNHQQDLDTWLDSSRTKFFHSRHGDRNWRGQ